MIIFGADLAEIRGQDNAAKQIIGKLDALKLPPGEREMFLADYHSRHNRLQQAIDNWNASLKANPTNPMAWQRLLAFYLKIGNTEQFNGPVVHVHVLPPGDEVAV